MWCWLLFSNFTRAFFLAVHQHVSLHPGPHYAIKGNSDTRPICHVTGYPTTVVSWRKSSGQLPQGRMRYNNSALQILHVRKEDSDVYFCSASNLLGRVEKKTLLVVASLPRFIVKPPAKVVVLLRGTLRLYWGYTEVQKGILTWRQDPLFRQAKQSTFEHLFHLKGSDLFTGVLFIYFVYETVQGPSS